MESLANSVDWLKKQQVYQECTDFLIHEADLLDQHRYKEWLELCTEDISYKVPIRLTRELNAETDFSDVSYHMNETIGSLNVRIKKTYSGYNWAEDPASRTRHYLSNFRMEMLDDEGHEVLMKTNLLLFRNKFDYPEYNLISSERHDTLRKENETWKLAKRIVYLDHSTVPMSNLAIFL